MNPKSSSCKWSIKKLHHQKSSWTDKNLKGCSFDAVQLHMRKGTCCRITRTCITADAPSDRSSFVHLLPLNFQNVCAQCDFIKSFVTGTLSVNKLQIMTASHWQGEGLGGCLEGVYDVVCFLSEDWKEQNSQLYFSWNISGKFLELSGLLLLLSLYR